MPLRMRLATEADAPAMGLIGTRAFGGNLSTIIFPTNLRGSTTEDEETTWRTARTLRRMKQDIPTYVVVDTPGDQDSVETVVGFAQWEPPRSTYGPPPPDVEIDSPPPTLDSGRMRAIEEMMEVEARRALGPDGHEKMWYLMMLCVDPDHKRRGVGRTLLEWGLSMGAAEGRKVYLLASPQGERLYKAQGFETLGEVDVFGIPHYSMLWTPQNIGTDCA